MGWLLVSPLGNNARVVIISPESRVATIGRVGTVVSKGRPPDYDIGGFDIIGVVAINPGTPRRTVGQS
jgi:hypothetical protein